MFRNNMTAIAAIILFSLSCKAACALTRAHSTPLSSVLASPLKKLKQTLSLDSSGLEVFFGENSASFESSHPKIRGVFINTNEIGSTSTLESLNNLGNRGNTGVGVSALFNLEMFARRYVKGVTTWVLIDPAPQVQRFWHVLKASISKADNLKEALELALVKMQENRSDYFSESFLQANCIWENDTYYKWLDYQFQIASQRLQEVEELLGYPTLKALVVDGLRLIPIDLTDKRQVQQLARYLSKNRLKLDTLYVSNVGSHIPFKATSRYNDNVALLRALAKDGTSYLVEAVPKYHGKQVALSSDKTFQKITY